MPRAAAIPSALGTMNSVKLLLLRRRHDLAFLGVDATNRVLARKLVADLELRKPGLRVGENGHLAVWCDRDELLPPFEGGFRRSLGDHRSRGCNGCVRRLGRCSRGLRRHSGGRIRRCARGSRRSLVQHQGRHGLLLALVARGHLRRGGRLFLGDSLRGSRRGSLGGHRSFPRELGHLRLGRLRRRLKWKRRRRAIVRARDRKRRSVGRSGADRRRDVRCGHNTHGSGADCRGDRQIARCRRVAAPRKHGQGYRCTDCQRPNAGRCKSAPSARRMRRRGRGADHDGLRLTPPQQAVEPLHPGGVPPPTQVPSFHRRAPLFDAVSACPSGRPRDRVFRSPTTRRVINACVMVLLRWGRWPSCEPRPQSRRWQRRRVRRSPRRGGG